MLRSFLSSVALAASLLVSPAFADSSDATAEMQFLSTATSWQNTSGSVVTFSFQPSSQPSTYIVTGHYVNNAAGYRCQGTPYPLSGIYYANTQTISFSVAWANSTEDCQSVTGWTGYIDLATSPLKMNTDWNLAYMSSSGQAIAVGSDLFTMQAPVVQERLVEE